MILTHLVLFELIDGATPSDAVVEETPARVGGGSRRRVTGRRKKRLIFPNGDRLWVWEDEIPRLMQEWLDAQEQVSVPVAKPKRKAKPRVVEEVAEERREAYQRISTLTDSYRQYAKDATARFQLLQELARVLVDLDEDEDIEILMMVS